AFARESLQELLWDGARCTVKTIWRAESADGSARLGQWSKPQERRKKGGRAKESSGWRKTARGPLCLKRFGARGRRTSARCCATGKANSPWRMWLTLRNKEMRW